MALELEDPFDAGQVHALVLRQPLHLAEHRDVTRRVATAAPAGAARRDEPDAVVLPQGLRVHPGESGRDRDDEDRGVVADTGRHLKAEVAHASTSPERCARGSSCCFSAYDANASRASSDSRCGTATSTVTSRSPRDPSRLVKPLPRTRRVRPLI